MFTISNHMYIEYVWYTHLCILHMWDRKGFRNLPVRVEGWRGDATSLTTSVLNYNLTASVGLKLGALTHIQLCDINVLLKDVMVDCGEVHEQGCLQRRFREFGSTSNQPHNHRPHVTTQAQDLHIQQMHLHDHQNPATRTAAATIGGPLVMGVLSSKTKWLEQRSSLGSRLLAPLRKDICQRRREKMLKPLLNLKDKKKRHSRNKASVASWLEKSRGPEEGRKKK
ncbi:uncharacterized protein LOC133558766 isoform X1 [Nerophis ophidion]|uniref:uncharacterized protein LOC133558766 isoform X1 n=1 Tax=Nerophis ophidion TaxID=159077 RepID=UPI002ADF9BF4|nr:uncharacterized protein LOC133558766 isoform X1 [Nerophis ophidion]